MTRVDWTPQHDIEMGCDRAVVYLSAGAVPWNGITSIEEDPSDATKSSYYFDGVKTLDIVGGQDFSVHLAAYFSPEELDDYRGLFGLTYRTMHGDGHKIHLLYNIRMVPTSNVWTSTSESINLSDFTWDLFTTPVQLFRLSPFSHMEIDVDEANPTAVSNLEDLLYGTETNDPTLPSAQEVIELFGVLAVLTIVDHGDGTWTATGPDDMVHMIDATTFEIVSPSLTYIDPVTYTVYDY